MTQKIRQIPISNITRQKVEAAKSYIQQRYSKLIQQEQQKRQYWQQLNRKMQQMNIPITQQQQIKKKINHQQAQILRKQRIKQSILDFTSINIIGKGAFGQVRLCKSNKDKQPVAIKKLKKSEMIFKNKVIQSRQQRNVLAISENNPWIVNLKCSFQDFDNLYLVMEYLPGGDLMNLLMKKDIFTHQEAQFYTAEILLALDSVHKMKYIHRDLKPDNVLLDANGHIKLSDFGLCKHTQIRPKKLTDHLNKKQELFDEKKIQFDTNKDHKRNRKLAYSAVGTPDYVAPEVQGRVGYTETVDWWSMGVILYEMLVGYPPFTSDKPKQTWHKIQNWRKYLVIPENIKISNEAVDLIRKLVTDPKNRLGINGVQEIKAHPFFTGIKWNKLREIKAPYIPTVKNIWDTSNFDNYQEEQAWIPSTKNKKSKKKTTEFIGYTYKPLEQSNSALVKALIDLDNYKVPSYTNDVSLDYLQLQKDPMTINSINRFKKDKTDRTNKQLYNTTVFNTTNFGKKNQRDKFKCYYADTPEKNKGIKRQSPSVKEPIKDQKKAKVKILQKKFT